MTSLVVLSWKAPAAKLEVLSGDVRCVRRIWRAQCPPSVPLQPSIQAIASPLLFHPVPQHPHVHLVHCQVQGTVHLWTQEERIQNTVQNTLAPWCGSKPRIEPKLNTTADTTPSHILQKNIFRGTVHKYFKEYSFYYQILQTQKNNQTALCCLTNSPLTAG